MVKSPLIHRNTCSAQSVHFHSQMRIFRNRKSLLLTTMTLVVVRAKILSQGLPMRKRRSSSMISFRIKILQEIINCKAILIIGSLRTALNCQAKLMTFKEAFFKTRRRRKIKTRNTRKDHVFHKLNHKKKVYQRILRLVVNN